LRLIRAAIGAVTLEGLAPGQWRLAQGDYALLQGSPSANSARVPAHRSSSSRSRP
jgi:hypothetical protein